LPAIYAGMKSKERLEKADMLLTMLGLADHLHKRPNQMSGGQQQRVAIARSIVSKPKVILADEPTGNLDSQTSVEILALFQELGRDGMTIILVTHEPDIATYASRIIMMKDGRIQSDSRQEAKLARSSNGSQRTEVVHEVPAS
jgi:ABC-type antimicrobial peptide transport system, ATPase component